MAKKAKYTFFCVVSKQKQIFIPVRLQKLMSIEKDDGHVIRIDVTEDLSAYFCRDAEESKNEQEFQKKEKADAEE